jgi:TPR repeat protein
MVVGLLTLVASYRNFSPTSYTALEAGVIAYERADGAGTLKILEPLALNGNAEAQYYLGRLFDNYTFPNQEPNRPREFYDNAMAANWYSLAAEQGNALAQAHLGRMYFYGDGVKQDYVKAHMWLKLATTDSATSVGSGLEVHKKLLNYIAAQMTADQIAAAERLREQWSMAARGEK